MSGVHASVVIAYCALFQTMWPDHCVQGSLGAAFHEDLLVYGVGCCWRVVWQGVQWDQRLVISGPTQTLWLGKARTLESTRIPDSATRRMTSALRKPNSKTFCNATTFDMYATQTAACSAFVAYTIMLQVFLAGLATDFCVSYTALDAARFGKEHASWPCSLRLTLSLPQVSTRMS